MKLLRSPWVSGALAVIAVVVVMVQFVPLHLPRAAKVLPPPPAPATPAVQTTTPAVEEHPASEPPDLPPLAIERTLAEARFAHALQAPNRDPFWLLSAAPEAPVHHYPSPVLSWKLNAIWRQTDSRVAAIDNHIYAEGDAVQGYRILRIEANQVVFEGPDGPEVLTFASAAASKSAKKK